MVFFFNFLLNEQKIVLFHEENSFPPFKNFTCANYTSNIVPYTKDELFTDTAISFIPHLYLRDHNIIGIIYKSGGEEKEDSQCNVTEEN